MYTSFFGLNEKPFSITPDPRYLFMSARHGEALAHLVYGVTESGGFIQLTGEVGTGKTTLVRTLLLNRMPSNADVAVILNPQQSAHEFVASICGELHVPLPGDTHSIKACIDALNNHLLKAHADGRRTILVVDEAQNLAPDVLEQVRMLTNLETAKQKLLQIILIGQPELRELLARTDLRQLAQRITGRYHLEPLTRDETAQYVEHRLTVAGALVEIFDGGAKRELFRLTQGIPRLVNVICDRALLGAYSNETRSINRRLVRRAAAEVAGETEAQSRWRWALTAVAVAAILVSAAVFRPSPDALPVASPDVLASPIVAAPPVQDEAKEEATTVMAAPITEEEPIVTLDEQLQLAAGLTGSDAAVTYLFGLWQLAYSDAAGTACEQALTLGMDCFAQIGSWAGLRQLDRPAILTLTDSGGFDHSVVLIAIENGQAELSIGGVLVTHPVESITDLWFGQYLLLWKPYGGASVALGPGSRNPSVAWLRRSLADIAGTYRSEPLDSEVFDRNLGQTVREFQRDHRLSVDGVAGRQTQIVINSLVAADDRPRLSRRLVARQ